MGSTEAVVTVLVAVFGAGGLVSLVKAFLDYRSGMAQKEDEAVDHYVARQDQRIEFLENERESEIRYQAVLIAALARAGVKIPPRRKD